MCYILIIINNNIVNHWRYTIKYLYRNMFCSRNNRICCQLKKKKKNYFAKNSHYIFFLKKHYFLTILNNINVYWKIMSTVKSGYVSIVMKKSSSNYIILCIMYMSPLKPEIRQLCFWLVKVNIEFKCLNKKKKNGFYWNEVFEIKTKTCATIGDRGRPANYQLLR